MKKIAWSERARADVRRLDRDTAMRIFTVLQRSAETGEGDVKKLKGESSCAFASATTASVSPKNLTTPSASIPFSIARKPTADRCFSENCARRFWRREAQASHRRNIPLAKPQSRTRVLCAPR